MHETAQVYSAAELAHEFKDFARHEARDTSPLYERLCFAIARDADLLNLAASATSRPVPNLLLAAVQYLLRRDADHPLRAFYPALGGTPDPEGDPVQLLRAFCRDHATAIEELLRTRRVQTNEVRRCALLLPAFALVARQAGDRPLALVEIGASAGFNLLWDQYGYDYSTGHVYGDTAASVQLSCDLRGDRRPPLPERMPAILSRLGIDLQPVDVYDPDAVDWLRALIWPEHTERLALLDRAVEAARRAHPSVRAGDALDLLPEALAQVPRDALLCLYHTFTVNQFLRDARDRLDTLLDAYGAVHDLCCVSIAGLGGGQPELRLLTYERGHRQERLLAHCHPHGHWIAWHDGG